MKIRKITPNTEHRMSNYEVEIMTVIKYFIIRCWVFDVRYYFTHIH